MKIEWMRLRLMPERMSCTWVPSPQSNRKTSPSRINAVEERPRVSVGTAELVPSTTIFIGSRLARAVLLEHCPEDVTCQPWVFSQSADRVVVPVAAERNVDAEVVAGAADHVAVLFDHTEKHLEFVGRGRDPQLTDQPQCFPHDKSVVGGNAYVGTVSEKLFENADVILIDLAHVLKRDFGRLDVYAFAKPVVGAQVLERRDIVEGPAQVGLDHDTQIRMSLSQCAIDLERVRGARGVLHIDANEVSEFLCAPDDTGGKLLARVGVRF